MKQDAFKDRYLIKIGSSVALAVFNLIIQWLIPRAFSVDEYAYYSYNLNVFTSVVVLTNLSASNALIAKFSKRNDEIGLVLFYLKFQGIISIILTVSVAVLYQLPSFRISFAGQTLLIVLLGLETAVVQRLLGDCIGLFDAMAISRFPAMLQIALKFCISVIVIAGYALGHLHLIFFYFVQLMLTFVTSLVMLIALFTVQRRQYYLKVDKGIKKYLKEFYTFCRPLVVSNTIAQLLIILMNWALMNWGGTEGQAIFGIVWQFNLLLSYIFSPYAELLKREFAIVYGDINVLRKRFIQALQIMAWLISYFAVFIAVCAPWILRIIYEDKYTNAALELAIIMFYTIYQAWGQICGSYLLAVENTKANALFGVIGQLLTLGGVLLFQIPNIIWRNGLGAVGISLTYLASSIIGVPISVCYIAYTLQLSRIKTLSIHIPPIAACAAASVGIRVLFDSLWKGNSVFVYFGKTLVTGIIYTLIIGLIIWRRPEWVGISRETIKSLLKNKNITQRKQV